MTALDIERIRAAFPGRRIDYYASVDSTMRAAVGLEAGSVVLAEEQTAGQGRLGRTWHSEAGAGIYCSMAVRPMPVLTLALGLAAQSAILEATGLMCDIRWPNDLLLGGKKVAGILVHGADGLGICGIGINVGHAEFPAELEEVATSLRLELERNDAGTPVRPTWGRMPSCAAIANRRAGRLAIGPQVASRPTCPTAQLGTSWVWGQGMRGTSPPAPGPLRSGRRSPAAGSIPCIRAGIRSVAVEPFGGPHFILHLALRLWYISTLSQTGGEDVPSQRHRLRPTVCPCGGE